MLSEQIGDKGDQDRSRSTRDLETRGDLLEFLSCSTDRCDDKKITEASENEGMNKLTRGRVRVYACMRACTHVCMCASACLYEIKEKTERKGKKPRFNGNVGVYE